MLKRLWRHVSLRRRKQLVMLLLLLLLASLSEVVSLGAVLPFLGVLVAPEKVFASPLAQPIISALEITEPKQLMLPISVIFALMALLSGGLRMLLLWAQTRLGYAIGMDLSFEIYRRTLYQPYSCHIERNSSEIIAGISTKVSQVVYHTILPFLMLISSVLMMIVVFGTLLSINATIALISFIGFGVMYAIIVQFVKKRLLNNSQCINRETNKVYKALQEGLGGIRDILIDGMQEVFIQVYRNADQPLRRAQASNHVIGSSPRLVLEALGMVMIVGIAYMFSIEGDGIAEAIPILGVLVLGAQRLLPLLQQGYAAWSQMRGMHESLNDSVALLEQPIPNHVHASPSEPMPFSNSIAVRSMSFRYRPDLPWVVQGLNLDIFKGDRIGFIGTTGSGKSTLLDIFMGLLIPTEGQLYIDDIPISENNYRAWQANVAHVPQTIFLADASITENIAFGVPKERIDHARVRHVARQAQIAETIEEWDEQYGTLVGERGVRLSGGQRQRIGIARALYKQANVIVFDEATSALDNETERSVMNAINNIERDITILIVAHRLTTLQVCDRVVVLGKKGIIERIGSYKDIVSKSV